MRTFTKMREFSMHYNKLARQIMDSQTQFGSEERLGVDTEFSTVPIKTLWV